MTFTIQIDVSGADDTEQFLEEMPGRVTSTAFFVFEQWGPELEQIASNQSPRDRLRGVDKRRNKPPFYLQWDHDVQRLGDKEIRLAVGNTDPRMPFVIGPTSPRSIPRGGAGAQRRKGYPMRFFWESGPTGPGWYIAWEIQGGVAGSGTKENPVHERAVLFFDIDRRVGQMADRIQEELTR